MNRKSVAALLFLFALLSTSGLHHPVSARIAGQDSDQREQPLSTINSPFEIITVDSQGDVGSHLSIAYNASRVPYIAYYDAIPGDLKIAHQSPGNCGPGNSWTCSILDNTSSPHIGQYVSLAFRSDGGYGVAYYDAANGVNRFTSPAAGLHGEIIEHVPNAPGGTWNALLYDNASVPHVAYVRTASGMPALAHAQRTGSGGSCSPAWNCQSYVLMESAISSDFHPISGMGIAFQGTGPDLGFARRVASGGNCGSTWRCSLIDFVPATSTAIAMARCGLLSCSTLTQIAYYDANAGLLKLASNVGDGQGNCTINNDWNCWVIDNVGKAAAYDTIGLSLVIDSGTPCIIYQDHNDQPNSVVKITYPLVGGGCGPGGNWRCTVVDAGARGSGFVSVGRALDATVIDGRIHIAYYEANHGDLLLAYQPAPAPPPVVYNIFLPFLER
jgi:hypothetical protein